MGNRISKVITRNGDRGTTTLANGQQYSKGALAIEAIGVVDELNALIGIGIYHLNRAELTTIADEWLTLQHHLFNLGGELALPNQILFKEEQITILEERITHYNEQLPPLKEFILPTGSLLISHTHLIRTVVRRTERLLWRLEEQEKRLNPISLIWLNRLSDYFFIMARIIAQAEGVSEYYWQSERLTKDE